MDEERRGFTFNGEKVWLAMGELREKLGAVPHTHFLEVWKSGEAGEGQ